MIRDLYKCGKVPNKFASDELPSFVSYQPQDLGLSNVDGNGRGIRVCIIDSGYPNHYCIPVPRTNVVDFTQSEGGALDKHGHGSGIAGIIKANGMMTGLAPMCDVYYAKALDNAGVGTHGTVQAAVLYSIIKKVDIIVMSFGSETSHPVLHDAIKKAANSKIAVFAACGNIIGTTKDAEYPARFTEVMSVGICSGMKPKVGENGRCNIDFPATTLQTLFCDNRYTKMSGTSILTAFAAGVAIRLAQKSKDKNGCIEPLKLYDEMMSLCSSV